MTINSHVNSGMSRRGALGALGSATLLSVSPKLLLAQSDGALHDVVAGRVRALPDASGATIRLLLPQGASGNLDPVIATFTQMTGVEVISTEVPVNEVSTELSLDILSNSQSYDVALPATFGVPDLVDDGAILPLSHFADLYEPDGFRDGILFDIGDSFDDEIYGFQTDGDAYLMFYNKTMMENPDERARYEDTYAQVLGIPRTWQDLDRQMAFFNRPDEGQFGGLLFRTPDYLAWEWWVRFHAKGVWPLSDDLEPQIASDQGVEALEEMIRASQHLAPEAKTLGLFENWKRYSCGDVYCNIGWGGSQKYFMGKESSMRGNLLYGQTPGGLIDGQLMETPYFNWGWNYVVSKNTRHKELSYLFALFASSPEISTRAIRATDGFFDPYRPEHYRDAAIQAAYSHDFLDVQRASLIGAIPDLYLRNQGDYFRVLTQWLTRALAGDVPPKDALKRVSQQWRLISNSSDWAQQKKRWRLLKEKYPSDLQQRMRDL